MVGNADLDLAIAVALAQSQDAFSDDDDFKPPGLNQQRLLTACRNAVPKMRQLKKTKQKKEKQKKEGSVPLNGKTSRARGTNSGKAGKGSRDETHLRNHDDSGKAGKGSREETHLRNHDDSGKAGMGSREETHLRNHDDAVVNEHAKRTASFHVAELDNFRFKRASAGALVLGGAAAATTDHDPPSEAPAETNCEMGDGGCPPLRAEGFPLGDSAEDDGADCLVIDINTEEVVELSNESQFSFLLRLCGEEDMEAASPQALLSAPGLPTESEVDGEGAQVGDDVTGGAILVMETGSHSSASRISHLRLNSAPIVNDGNADARTVQLKDNPEEEVSQTQSCQDDDDDISSMMTQKCPSVAIPISPRMSPQPLPDGFNLSTGVDVDMQSVNRKFQFPVVDTMELEIAENNFSGGGALLQARELSGSPKQTCDRITGSAPCETTGDAETGNRETLSCELNLPAVDCNLGPDQEGEGTMKCPVCGEDISDICVEDRVTHTNSCLDRLDNEQEFAQGAGVENALPDVPGMDRVIKWLEELSLLKYVSVFVEQEIDWETLPWLTEEDFLMMGITAVGPRRKLLRALEDLKNESAGSRTEQAAVGPAANIGRNDECQIPVADSNDRVQQGNGRDLGNFITNYFPLPPNSGARHVQVPSNGTSRFGVYQNKATKRPRNAAYHSTPGVPSWMCIPGTPFRVDAFQHLSGDCSHWFLTHFHTDHYQGLTRGFRHGHIFCSSITARLVNLRIGVSWDKLMIIPLNDKFKIAGVDVTFIDANHCPGSVMILFEPPNGEAVLHTGDFRFCKEMVNNALLQTAQIHTLVLDTTYCDPQYDFPPQETVVQFVVEAIQAEAFNPDTLFLIGAYTIGKERIFLEVAKALKKYVYVGVARKRLLDCMDLAADDTRWLTCNPQESYIHVVPLWSISSFKRMSSLSRHYQDRYKLIVAFYPSGWSFGRGKKKTPGKRCQQGTMIRYEVPYSEHCSFPELKEFLKFMGPDEIIPSVPDKSGRGTDEMIATLWSEGA